MPPTCLVAVALLDATRGESGDGGRRTCDREAVVCVVDTAVRVIRCYLLAEPPEIHPSMPDRSSILQDRDVVSQLANLLQELQWWKDTEIDNGRSDDNHGAPHGCLDVTCSANGRSESENQVLQIIEQYGRVRPQVQTIEQSDEELLSMEMQQQIELRMERMAKRSHALQTWKADFPLQYKWFLCGVHGVMTKWQLYEEAKYEGVFELELHTELVNRYMRSHIYYALRYFDGRMNPAARIAFTPPISQNQSILRMTTPYCCTKAGKKRLAQVRENPHVPAFLSSICLTVHADHDIFCCYFHKMIDRPCVESNVLRQRHKLVSALWSISSQPSSATSTAATGRMWCCVSSLLNHFRSFEAQQMDKFVRLRRLKSSKLLSAPSLQDFERLENWLTELSVLLLNEEEGTNLYPEDEKIVDDEFISLLRGLWRVQLSSFCKILSDTIHPFAISSTFDLESEVTEHKQRAAQLHELREQMRHCESEIEHVKRQVASVLRLSPERIKTVFKDDNVSSSLRGMRVLLRVSRQDSHRIHQHSGSLLTVQRTSKASGMLFSSEKLDQLSAAWKALKQSQNEAEDALVQQLVDILQLSAGDALAQLVEIVAEMDVLQGFASLSRKKGFVRPQITGPDDSEWSLRIVNPFDPFQDRKTTWRGVNSDPVPPVEVKLSRKEGRTFLLLANSRNSNAEAKNHCTLHTIGLIVTLSQIGCFVPCQEAQLPVFDAIYLRTGAYDEQLFGHSTFMTEMMEMKKIFTFMTPASLVLVDDLCRGTSIVEGLALAVSMCQHLVERGVMTCFTSEWRELVDQLLLQTATIAPQYLYDAQWFPGPNEKLASGDGDQDSEFVDLMAKYDFPTDLIQLIQSELQSPHTSKP